ncbi:hypothetical protein [Paenibacillus mucilaginosus]|uniref:Uncharacterized protein n=3 Tax=Paenibacillus mucilaginosus TaxID=61624 RepID=H6NFZ8_9BACL|nr:hypothetical protein [Paenibacillus mucilaginosus]AFC31417.1 hypothetical protein PM3016_4673 [Paenibacillus mucilaginosus 3016]AFH63756.1 hypothetical protein B2K_24235 [Paenibacillus mucilaginosus K02]MCG7212675.1 hypothetical protein [Paenibacillus mucilaginosus]WDM25306.1 hypothetical protein KCX80_22930 [Paenibacillus mucilaginosus]WFA19966.1 hypothetical protein ERY13_23380 [Paenibacillus mucilaginosus]
MKPKLVLVVGTMVLTITIGGGLWSKDSKEGPLRAVLEHTASRNIHTAQPADLLSTLGASSEEEVYDALLEGKSLAVIAESNGRDAREVVELQTAELAAQLDARLAGGSLGWDDYLAQRAELREIVERSVYGEKQA